MPPAIEGLAQWALNDPVEVEITTETEGAEIRYTIDNSLPSPTRGLRYTGPVRIARTTTLRAAAFKDGLGPTNTDTHTYIFLDDVITQNVMRTSITRDPRFAPQMRGALTDLPSLCITSPSSIQAPKTTHSIGSSAEGLPGR